MGLDIYAGTLTRYYSHNWKTVVQQWAEENGYSFNCITPDGQYSKLDIAEHTRYDTQSLAKFAFSMFWRAMRFAEEQQVPILLDY